MSILGAIARYLAVMGIAAGVGLMLTRLGIGLAAASGSDTSAASTYVGLWIIISLVVSMVLAGVSFFFLGVEYADRVSHHAGRAIGNSVTLDARHARRNVLEVACRAALGSHVRHRILRPAIGTLV